MILTLEYGVFKDEYNLDPKICGWPKIYDTLDLLTKKGYISSELSKKILLKLKVEYIEKDFKPIESLNLNKNN